MQRRRDKRAAKKFFRKLLKGLTYVPRVIVTDKLKSYGAAKREILPGVEQRQPRYLNNRAENSHQPIRQRRTQKVREAKVEGIHLATTHTLNVFSTPISSLGLCGLFAPSATSAIVDSNRHESAPSLKTRVQT